MVGQSITVEESITSTWMRMRIVTPSISTDSRGIILANCTQLLPPITKLSHLENIRTEANHPRYPSGVLEDITLPGRDQSGLPVAALKSTTKAMPVSPCRLYLCESY